MKYLNKIERKLYCLKLEIIKNSNIDETKRKQLADMIFNIEKLVKNNSVSDNVINTPTPCSCCGKLSCSGGCL